VPPGFLQPNPLAHCDLGAKLLTCGGLARQVGAELAASYRQLQGALRVWREAEEAGHCLRGDRFRGQLAFPTSLLPREEETDGKDLDSMAGYHDALYDLLLPTMSIRSIK
jgi:hypothetical protein